MTPEERLKLALSTTSGRLRLAEAMESPVRGVSPFRQCRKCLHLFPTPGALSAHSEEDCCVYGVMES